jgi:hypothetical protein
MTGPFGHGIGRVGHSHWPLGQVMGIDRWPKDWAARVAYLEISGQVSALEFSKRILGKRMTGLSHDRPLRSGQVTIMPIDGHGSGHGHASAVHRT